MSNKLYVELTADFSDLTLDLVWLYYTHAEQYLYTESGVMLSSMILLCTPYNSGILAQSGTCTIGEIMKTTNTPLFNEKHMIRDGIAHMGYNRWKFFMFFFSI